METIAIFNTRGGSGKSAATVFLADFLATVFTKRVLVVDLDPQQSSSVALLGEERLYEALGRKQSLPLLIERARDEEIHSQTASYFAIERPKNAKRKGTVYLEPVWVMSCEKESWNNLDQHSQPTDREGLRRVLRTVKSDFDVCLIDFPGHYVGPITQSGLRAADWWLFPCVPDRPGIRDIEGPVKAITQAYRGSRRHMQGLGTLLSIAQGAAGNEYRRAFHTLSEAADKGIVPRLFSRKTRMLVWTAARTALDDTLWDSSTTLKQKYQKPLYDSARSLAKEVLQRLDMPSEEVQLDFGPLDGLNRMLRNVFVGPKQ